MIPVQQTTFGNGNGNCLLACVASLLHRPISDIPDFNLSGAGWFEEMYEWCRNENMGLILVNPSDLERSLFMNCFCIMIYTIHGVESENHAVIGKCQRVERSKVDEEGIEKWKWQAEVVFDPNPKGAAIDELKHLVFITECAPAPAQGTPEPPKVEEVAREICEALAKTKSNNRWMAIVRGILRPYFPHASQTDTFKLHDELLGGAVKVIRPTDLRNRVGMYMMEERGVKMGSNVDPGDVQDMIVEFAQREIDKLATPASTARTDGLQAIFEAILPPLKFTGPDVRVDNLADRGWNTAVREMKRNMEKYLLPAAPGSVPQAEPPKCSMCRGVKRVKKPDGCGSMTCPKCSRGAAQPGDAPQKEKP